MAKKNMKETVEAAKDVMQDAVEDAKVVVEETVKRTKKGAKKAEEEARKVTESVKKAAQKVAVKEVFIQFAGAEYKESEILEKVEAAYKAEGHRLSAIRSMELYIKPEDGMAYYVINGKTTGSVEL